jgi:lipoprotein-anchoring transpeptidase ErfK/SrfK
LNGKIGNQIFGVAFLILGVLSVRVCTRGKLLNSIFVQVDVMAMSRWLKGGRSSLVLGILLTSTNAIAQPIAQPNPTAPLSGELTVLPKIETIIILPNRNTQQPATPPTVVPTVVPTLIPTVAPTPVPTVAPTTAPTIAPTPVPTVQPTIQPTVQPLAKPAPVEETVKLVVQRSKRRVMVYKGEKVVAKFPIAVGKTGWETPVGDFKVINKEENPIFKSFKTGMIIEPGPDNPLGVRWIGIWTDGKTQLGFHGTDQPELIGQAVSHGCIRMHNKDVVALYKYVEIGTVVRVNP